MHPIRELLAGAKRVVALTGAGISAESGIPTFRGSGGLWKQYRAEDLATPAAFARDPKLVWEWYDWRRGRIAAAEPNAGHTALVELEERTARGALAGGGKRSRPAALCATSIEEKVPDFTLITQNVDGLHQRAGSRRILPLHGDIWTLSCTACGRRERDMRATLPDLPPCCACGGLLRPGVVWFGEPLPSGIWEEAQAATRRAEVLLVIGTSAVVYPAASLVPLAKSSGAKIVEINTDETPMSAAIDYVCRGPAGETLPQLLA